MNQLTSFPNHQAIPTLAKIVTLHRQQILALAERHGAYNVRIFGSVARGDARADSDIDFLVDYDLNRITPWFPNGLLLDLEQLLSCKIDIATLVD